MVNWEGIKYKAMLAGFFAGSATCVAKFALDPSSPIPNFVQEQCLSVHTTAVEETIDYTCLVLSLLPRGLFLLAMVGLNLLMVASMMQGMVESGTVVATALATGTNFSLSAAYGIFLWGEKFNVVWLVGFSLILLGVCMLASVSVTTIKKTNY